METGFPRFAAFAAWQFLACAHFADAREPLLARGANRAIVITREVMYFIQKILFSFLKRWRVLGRRKNLFSFNQEKSFSASLNNFR